MENKTDILICGAGIAGISTAYHLAVRQGIKNVWLVDDLPPLSLTSDKSTECYRNWWPDGSMIQLINRSIDLMEGWAEESNNIFRLNRRGYLYLSADESRTPEIENSASRVSQFGAGPLRIHRGSPGDPAYIPSDPEEYQGQPVGADLFLSNNLIQKHFSYVSKRAVSALHVRRAGWFSAQQLGMYLLEQARKAGVKLVEGRVTGIQVHNGRVQSVELNGNQTVSTTVFVNAAGPHLQQVAGLMGIKLPVFSELHQKVAFKDNLGVIARDTPLLIWTDPQVLNWSDEELEILSDEDDTKWLTGKLPSGVHTRPEGNPGSPMALMLWEYRTERVEPTWPLPLDQQYPEIVLRGLSTMLPGLQAYIGKSQKPILDGGYYIKTRENRPIIGALPVEGAYAVGALSGFGIMAGGAAGELAAAQITSGVLPTYASAFSLYRYDDPEYLKMLDQLGESGQL